MLEILVLSVVSGFDYYENRFPLVESAVEGGSSSSGFQSDRDAAPLFESKEDVRGKGEIASHDK